MSPAWAIGAGIAFAGLLLACLGVIVAFIRWGISLEAKHARSSERCDRLEQDEKELRDKLEAHQLDAKIHVSHEVSRQVDEKNNQRFKHIEDELNEINGKLDTLMDRKH